MKKCLQNIAQCDVEIYCRAKKIFGVIGTSRLDTDSYTKCTFFKHFSQIIIVTVTMIMIIIIMIIKLIISL